MTDHTTITNLRKVERFKNKSKFKAYKQQKAPVRLLLTLCKTSL